MNKKPRSAGQQVPVGLEQVLLAASTDAVFRQQLLEQRERAVEASRLPLRDSERAILRSIPREQLLAAIERVDASPSNLRRRRFMKAVAASAAAVVAAESFGGCDGEASDGIRPDLPNPSDGGVDGPTVDLAEMDSGLDGPATKGIRPNG